MTAEPENDSTMNTDNSGFDAELDSLQLETLSYFLHEIGDERAAAAVERGLERASWREYAIEGIAGYDGQIRHQRRIA